MSAPKPPPVPTVVRRDFSAGGPGAFDALSTQITTAATAIFSRNWQVGGVYNGLVAVTIPALAANGSAVVAVPGIQFSPANITGTAPAFPASIKLQPGQTALVTLNVTLAPNAAAAPTVFPLVGLPYCSLTYSGGVAGAQVVQRGTLLTLTGPGTWLNLGATISLTAVTGGVATSATTVQLSISAILYGTAS